MRTIKTDLYTINELSEDAQHHAYMDWLNGGGDEFWSWDEGGENSLNTFADRIGIMKNQENYIQLKR